jgi:hypothetical protein
MRAWTYRGHITGQNVKQLRQFIDARPTQEFADAGYAAVAATCLSDVGPVLKHRHRPEFQNKEFLSIETIASLLKYHRARAIKLDGNGGDEQNWPKEKDRDEGNTDVESPFGRQ